MSKVSKKPCKLTLEEEYRYEHLARIKAQNYIEEIWEYCCELQKEVSRLQSIINKGEHKVEKRVPLNRKLELDVKLDKLYREREKSVNNMDKIIKRVFK